MAPSGPDSAPADASASGERPRIDFYVLEAASGSARLKLACRLAEKAYLANQIAVIWHTDPNELRAVDELLWTFDEHSFVPHELLSAGTPGSEAPVLLTGGPLPPERIDIVINLSSEVPLCLSRAPRIADIVDGDEARRRAGRARFKAYRELGLQPASHNVRA